MNINIENLSLTYGQTTAVNNVSMKLNERKIYGLLGRNGAGKTSLLSIIGSFREATSGMITINGEYPFENGDIMKDVNFLYDKNYKEESSNVKDILARANFYRPNFDATYANYLIDLFKLPTNQEIKKFSKGMQSALNVTVGLASRCPITIFDEVYLGMDAPSRDLFYKELLKEQETNPRMIILSTHLVSEMDYLFDEVIILHEGEVLLQQPIDTLLEQSVAIFGRANNVDEVTKEKRVIHEEKLGDTKSAIIFDSFTKQEQQIASDKGLELSTITLNELFIHLTKEAK